MLTGRRWEREPVCTVVVLFVQELFWDGQLDTKFKKKNKVGGGLVVMKIQNSF